MSASTPRRFQPDWRTVAAIVLAAVAFANAALYIADAGNPFVTSDGWYFVDAFLQKYYNGGIDLRDLYMKRPGGDHAQPIHKLLLLWNADAFDLDFVVEAYVGLGFATIAWLLMLHAARQDGPQGGIGAWRWLLAMAVTAASLVSLNGGMAFTWSLVTLSYLGPLALVALAMAAWQAVERRHWLPLLLVAPLVAFSMDGTAVLCGISVVFCLALREIKQRGVHWRTTVTALALVTGALIAYHLASRLYLHAGMADEPATDSLSTLLGFGWKQLLKMGLSLAALSVADRAPLQEHFPTSGERLHLLLGLLVAIAHLWFWWRVLRDRWNRTQFIAVALMLFTYGAMAGIVLVRVPLFGPGYIFQQRYLMLYQLGIVALALMAAGAHWSQWRGLQRHAVTIGLALLLAIQLPLSQQTWKAAPYVRAYGNNQGREIVLLGIHPSMKLASCVPMLVVCEAPRAEQVRSITLLRDHHLNAFSNRMLARYSMQPLAADPGPVELVSPPPP